jgi:oligopeptide transport system ATP-binding protein
VSYKVDAGETLAIVGESGSGKTVSAQAIMGIIDTPPGFITGGEILFRGDDILKMSNKERRAIRGEQIAMIFQDALTALNPVYTVGWQIAEMYRKHRGTSKSDALKQAVELMDRVKIPSAKDRVKAYPHEFSGGMRQRVMIAMALSLDPDVLIADEPTTALDVTVQAQIMGLLDELQKDTGMGLILITHDLGVVAEVADRISVMYAGKIVETADIKEIFANPAHPYTLGLLKSLARPDVKGQPLEPIVGSPPDLLHLPTGCAFHPRCRFAEELCVNEIPERRSVAVNRTSACHFAGDILEGVGV